MVDKIWYDWQQLDSLNAGSFFGGSVQSIDTVEDYEQYPNGGPPFLGVSAYDPILPKAVHLDLIAKLNSTMPADGMFPELTIGDVLNTTGGVLCYVYG
jgi:tyrosinase